MRITRTGVAAAFAVTAALTLSACAGGGSPAASPTDADSSPVQGGDLTFAVANDPISLNPSGTGSGNDTLYVTRQLVDSLLYQNPDTGDLEPWLATSYEVNDDATVFTFDLRDDVTFSDGTPFTAENVKATFDDIVAAGALSQAVSLFVGYESTDVIDDHTVEVHFSTPNAAFPNSTSSVALGIVGDATVAVPFDQRADGSALVGTGPFTLESYKKDTETVLSAREDYAWAPASLGNDSRAYLDTVTFQIVPEASVRTGSLTSDQVDVIGGVQPTDVETLDSSGYPLVWRGNPGVTFGLSFNQSRPTVSDIQVREAIAAAIDATTVRDTSLNDYFNVATSVLAVNTPAFADQSSYFVYDPDHAKELLDDAGWIEGSDGIREKDGQKLALKLWWIANFGPNQTSLELIQQELKEVGIDLTLQSGTVPEFIDAQKGGDFDIVWGNNSRADGDILRTSFSSAATNYYKIDDPELEALLQKQLATSDPDARAAVIADVQERIASQYYQIPVHELTSILGTQSSVHGITLGADSRLNSLVTAWKDAD
ncbi:ABC transporter substrate-binding protein [Microbacterium sp.]|uniref:ABC transporter substrate-binding protein n=1 Tax=Microbacterium sp. TaxID=51671 RepID=UPI003C711EC4